MTPDAIATTHPRHSSRGDRRTSAAPPRTLRFTLLALEGVVAIAAFGGGAAMISDPAEAMGLAPEMLDRLPVDSWLLPGVALITCNGLLPAVVAGAELIGRRWPRRFGHALAGAVLLAWPVTETVLFGYPLDGEPLGLRPAVAATGLGLIGLGLVHRVAATDAAPATV